MSHIVTTFKIVGEEEYAMMMDADQLNLLKIGQTINFENRKLRILNIALKLAVSEVEGCRGAEIMRMIGKALPEGQLYARIEAQRG